jgi:hypothetical protein
MIAVGCAQIQKLNATLLDMRYEYITAHSREEYEEDYKRAKTNLQTKLNVCIRHHQEIMA